MRKANGKSRQRQSKSNHKKRKQFKKLRAAKLRRRESLERDREARA